MGDKKIREWFSGSVIEKAFPYRRWRRIRFWTGFFRLASLIFMVLALTGPKFGRELKTVSARGSTVFILFDCSASMLAEDLKPNRLERAKILFSGLLEKMLGDRVGIIAFAGEPFVFCPLTFDLSAARQFLRSMTSDMVPVPGTHIGSAVRLALSKMPETGSRAIVLLTDGEDHKSDPLGAGEEAARAGVRIFAIGVGNSEGEPIPIKDDAGRVTGFKNDAQGKIVLSKLDEATLIQMAQETGGAYARADPPDAALDLIFGKLSEMDKNPLARKKSGLKDRYQWALALAFLLFFIGESIEFFGAGAKAARWAVLIFLLAVPARAASFREKISEGNRLYQEKKYEQALESYENAGEIKPQDLRASYNKGAAQYRLKAWSESAEELKKSALASDSRLRSRALFNLGNARFQAGSYREAAESYQESLRIDPSDVDARENLRLALRFIKNPPPKQQNKSGGKEKEGQGKSEQAKAQEREKKENAKRILKGASGEDGKPEFKSKEKNGKKKDILEDW